MSHDYFCADAGLDEIQSLHPVYHLEAMKAGLRPTIGCSDRFFWMRDKQIPEMEAFVTTAYGKAEQFQQQHLESIKRSNPDRVREMLAQWSQAAYWELKRYGSVAVELRVPKLKAVAA